MMSVLEYANDINMDVEIVLKKAIELGYANSKDDMLSEDAVIDLDNVLTMNTQDVEEPTYLEE